MAYITQDRNPVTFVNGPPHGHLAQGALLTLSNPKSLTDPILVKVFDYWSSKRSGRKFPARKHIDPVELRGLCPYLMLVDIGDRMRFRLVGTGVANQMQFDPTGRYVDEDFGDHQASVDFVASLHGRVLDEQRPIFAGGAYVTHVGIEKACRRILMPLASNGEDIDMVLTAAVSILGPPHREMSKGGVIRTVFETPL